MSHATYRPPTVQEIAEALVYINSEFEINPGDDGLVRIDAVHWTEGLAYGPGGTYAYRANEYLSTAQEVLPQLHQREWTNLAALADRERSNQGMPTQYTTGYVSYRR